jgi:hypothetical protein
VLRGGALAGLWASVHLGALALLLAARGADPESLYRELLATVAVATAALGVLSGGSYGPRTCAHELRRGDRAARIGVLVGAAVTVVLAVPVARSAEADGGLRLLAAASVVAVAGVVVHRWWSRADLPAAASARPWMLPSTVTATFVAASLATMAVGLPDVYPVSSYPMYSAERGHDYQVDTISFVGITEDGIEEGLGRPVSRQALLSLADAGDLDGLERLLRDQIGDDHPYELLEIRRESVQIARHPEPVEVRTVDAEVLWASEAT